MINIAQVIADSIAAIPPEILFFLSLPILLSVPLNMCKWMCTDYGRGRRRVVQEMPEKGKAGSTAPIPCDIHNDCTDCAFNGTGYCWRVMKHE